MKNRASIVLLGVSHNTAPVAMRDELHLPDDVLVQQMPNIKEEFGFHEIMALSTCNRCELLGVVDPEANHQAQIFNAFIEIHKRAQTLKSFSTEEIQARSYFYVDADAIRHAYRVASSLDSLILGETQITGQFKNAMRLAAQVGTSGPLLGRLSQEALATTKKIRSQTAIGQHRVSISHAAIDLIKKVFGEPSDHTVLIIGAGEMARVAAEYLRNYAPKQLVVTNRTLERAQNLVTQLGYGEAHPLSELENLLQTCDIVLSSTGASGLVVDARVVRAARKKRGGRAMCLVDIAIPRDIDPTCGEIEDVYLFDIDDLQKIVEQNQQAREQAGRSAEQIVLQSVDMFRTWLENFGITPVLASFRAYLDDTMTRESGRTLSKSHFQELSTKQRQSLEALFKAITNRIAADASKQIKTPPPGVPQHQLAGALETIFALEQNASANLGDEATQSDEIKSESSPRRKRSL